ncbi:MAG: T9SS type A sorting domain-containing protein [Hymenobacteraceae bacterium]|nr:T9SS type A sorting domain-containing protein [Hymenobacteraceae bacterium]
MSRNFPRYTSLSVAALLVAGAFVAEAKEDVNRPRVSASGSPSRITADLCLSSSSRSELDINNVRAMVLNGGDMWWDLNNPQYEVPKVTEANQPRRHSIFAGALWIGGVDNTNQLYVAAQTYRQGTPPDAGFWPGPLEEQSGSITRDVCSAWNAHAKINKSLIDQFRASGIPAAPEVIPQAIREWPGRNNPYIDRPRLDKDLAPFIDADGDGNYDPMRGDYPDILGDQAIWWVMNDAGGIKEPFTPAIGLEVDVMAFAFQTSDLLNNMTFYQQKVINKGQKTLNQTWIGQWVDPDLGYFNDDFVGCDVSRGLGFCYNGDDNDEGVSGYGTDPPTVSVDFFEGPLADARDGIDNDRDSYLTGVFNPDSVDEPGEKIIMSNFVYYNNDFSINGNPTASAHYYNYLRSKITTGIDLRFGGDGLAGTSAARPEPYAFMFPDGGCINSDPHGFGFHNPPIAGIVPPHQWAESNTNGMGQSNVASDRRFLQSAGPFTLLPGAVTNVTVGVIWTRSGGGGAQGSIALNCVADDLAQELFDLKFRAIKGPPAPIVRATELDQQIVLAIQPGTTIDSKGRTLNTENYNLKVESTSPGVPDRNYKFEGYLVYETIRENIEGSELNDENKARLIARGDIANGVKSIFNVEFDTDVNTFVPRQKIDAKDADRGIFHTLNVTTTQFPDGDNPRLVNYKRYYFKVVPYAYNEDPSTATNRAIVRYLPGNLGRVTAIPAKITGKGDGTVVNANVFDQVPIKRVLGIGAGGHVLNISDNDEQDIVKDGEKLVLSYKKGNAPIKVQIYDPTRVSNQEFTVKFSSSLTFRHSTIQGRDPQVNDTIVSTGQYFRGESGRAAVPADTIAGTPALKRQTARIDTVAGPQIPGRAIVRRIVSVQQIPSGGDDLVTLELEMLNDHLGGTFTATIGRYEFNGSDSTLVAYEIEPRPFAIKGAGGAIAQEYTQHDLWKWRTQGQLDWHYVERRVSEINEELIPEYGLTIQVRPGRDPGYRIRVNTQAQFQEATLTHTGQAWLSGVPNEEGSIATTRFGVEWLQPTDGGSITRGFDPNNVYSNKILPFVIPNVVTLGGTWAAYSNTLEAGSGSAGARYKVGSKKRLYNLHSVDVVMTSDKSKWTKVAVLQIKSNNPAFTLTKRSSRKPSVNKDGQPSGDRSPFRTDSISRGMGWFPGYAIDINRGIRLNMMFAESAEDLALGGQGPVLGADLIWNPGTDKQAGRNFIYVTDTKYDEGREMERQQDEIGLLPAGQAQGKYKTLYNQVMWVGYPRLIFGRTLLQSDARVRIRVDRAFTSYPAPANAQAGPNTNPEYSFSLNGQAVQTGKRDVACSALSLVRVVPNPYYAFSQYEGRQLDNIVKLTNLPRQCTITIYTLNGTLVRRLKKDNSAGYLDYDLKNDNNLPLASGIYLFHIVDKSTGCEEIVKWFGVLRPADLESF